MFFPSLVYHQIHFPHRCQTAELALRHHYTWSAHWLLTRTSSDLQKDKEDLEEVATELELADEDELVPYVSSNLSEQLWIF